MIRIISGTYGYRPRKGIVEPKKAGEPPFELSSEQEAALVAKGVAEYVTGYVAEEEEPGLPVYDASMPFEELKAIALYYGITPEELKPLRSKVAVIAVIDAKLNEGGGADDDPDGKKGGVGDDGTGGDGNTDPDAPKLTPEEPQ